MMLSHFRFTLEVELKSDLHLGTGETIRLSKLRKSNRISGEDADPEVAVTAKDTNGKPYLSATALKSACRRVFDRTGQGELADKLFGKINKTPRYRKGSSEVLINEGQMGCLSFGWATMKDGGRDLLDLPLYDAATCCWISTRTRIDGARGTVKRHHLFNREFVAKGTKFDIDCIYTGSAEDARGDIGALLGAIASAGSLEIGQGGRLGNGQVKLTRTAVDGLITGFDPETLSIKTSKFDVKPATSSSAVNDSQKLWKISLKATAPFLVADPYGRQSVKAADADRSDKGGNNVICALRSATGGPALPSSTFLGGLRACAVWLACLENPDHRDDPDLKPSAWSDPSELSVTERLFGVSGWRGTLGVSSINDVAPNAYPKTFSGIAIDRFSGGVIDGALFATEAFCHTAFDVILRHDERGDAVDDDREFITRLIAFLKAEGIELGHSTNNGFGWFDVTGEEK